MASQQRWSYNDALANFNRTNNPQALADMRARLEFAGEGGPAIQPGGALPTHLSRTWTDLLRDNAYQMVGDSAYQMTPAQWEQIARQNGILGGIENTPGEIFKDGMNNGLGLLAAFFGGGAMNGWGGAAAASNAAPAGFGSAGYAGGAAAQAGSGAAAGAAGAAGSGSLMPAAVPETAGTLSSWGLVETAPGVWSAAAPAGGVAAASGAAGSGSAGTAGTAGTAGGAASKGILDTIMSNPQILGAGAGALLAGLGGGSEQAGTTTTEEGLPEWLKQYAKPALDRYGTELQNYQIDPYGVMASAGKQYSDTVNGMYLDPETNKYLKDYFNAGAERVKGTLSPSFGHMQAFGSHTGYNEALAGGLSDLATGIYGGNYQQERDRQAALTAAAPGFIQGQSQAAFSPYQSYLDTVSKLGKSKQQPYFENPFGNILGGAMAGYGLGNIFK
jgi:hypothetical protein